MEKSVILFVFPEWQMQAGPSSYLDKGSRCFQRQRASGSIPSRPHNDALSYRLIILIPLLGRISFHFSASHPPDCLSNPMTVMVRGYRTKYIIINTHTTTNNMFRDKYCRTSNVLDFFSSFFSDYLGLYAEIKYFGIGTLWYIVLKLAIYINWQLIKKNICIYHICFCVCMYIYNSY